jgi:hypothetical protein
MQRHIRMHKISTYFNIPHVEKIGNTTRKQTPNQTPTTKRNLILKPSCGSLEISTSRKEQSSELQIELLAESLCDQ